MSEQSEQEVQESSKTVVSFTVGLIVGGLLVWVFSGSPEAAPAEVMSDVSEESQSTSDEGGEGSPATSQTERETQSNNGTETQPAPQATLPVGDGSVSVENQPAGTSVALSSATFPTDEGWIGVREYNNGELGYLLGVVRYSKEQGLVPTDIILQRATTPGREYAIVFYSEDGDRVFSLAGDVQIQGVFETFTAQ